jgi:glyoxylase-like metal-dependent hydrolase (beta-lactamase superfamily II)
MKHCMYKTFTLVAFIALTSLAGLTVVVAQNPEWCKQLPRPEYNKLIRMSTPDPWFQVYSVRPGVLAIYEPQQAEEVISYLILGKKRALLFDTGMGISNMKKLVQGLTPLPVSVLNSHTHNDHVGDNWQFQGVQSDDIYAMDTAFTRASAKGSRDDAQAEIKPDQLCGPLPAGFDARTYATRPFKVTHWLHGGDTIDLGGRVLKVITTPGHTPDSISLLDQAHGLLFTGDTYYRGLIYLYRPETDLDAYEASLKKMVALAPGLKLLLPAHNVPEGSPADLQRQLTAFRKVRAGQVKPEPHGKQFVYKVDGFSFLMAK